MRLGKEHGGCECAGGGCAKAAATQTNQRRKHSTRTPLGIYSAGDEPGQGRRNASKLLLHPPTLIRVFVLDPICDSSGSGGHYYYHRRAQMRLSSSLRLSLVPSCPELSTSAVHLSGVKATTGVKPHLRNLSRQMSSQEPATLVSSFKSILNFRDVALVPNRVAGRRCAAQIDPSHICQPGILRYLRLT